MRSRARMALTPYLRLTSPQTGLLMTMVFEASSPAGMTEIGAVLSSSVERLLGRRASVIVDSPVESLGSGTSAWVAPAPLALSRVGLNCEPAKTRRMPHWPSQRLSVAAEE